jgi:hypothetical protein
LNGQQLEKWLPAALTRVAVPNASPENFDPAIRMPSLDEFGKFAKSVNVR